MEQNKAQGLLFKLFVGGSLLIVGVGILLQNLNVLQFSDLFSQWWPMFVILYGIAQIVSEPRTFLGAIFVLGFGIIAQLYVLNIITVNPFTLVFPLILIFVGVKIVFNSAMGKVKGENSDKFVTSTAVFGASDVVSNSQSFEGGVVTSLFGGSKIDLRKAKMSEKGASIDLNVAFGGTDIIVPKNWQVQFNTIPVFGGWSNKSEGTDGPILTIKGVIVFGGAEIKTFDSEESRR
jgi:predicted membrane protein